eukprot:11730573-Prorocentrum_lima.AAC.1
MALQWETPQRPHARCPSAGQVSLLVLHADAKGAEAQEEHWRDADGERDHREGLQHREELRHLDPLQLAKRHAQYVPRVPRHHAHPGRGQD